MQRRHDRQLARVLSVFDNTLITLSLISPASVLFVMAPLALGNFGMAAFWSYVVGAFICMAMAFCWAELGTAHPSAGGDYAIAVRVLGPQWGFVCLMLQLAACALVPPLFALGLASYLKAVIELDATLVAMIAIGLAALVAVLRVRIGAAVTGVFLVIELAVLGILAYLGFSHLERSMMELLVPLATDTDGVGRSVDFGKIMAGAALALFSYDGYRCAINLSEEMAIKGKSVASATLWSLSIAVVSELVPLTAVMLGAASITSLGAAPDLTAFVVERGGPALNTVVSLAVAGAIFNCLIAFFIIISRLLFSSGRDHAWPGPLSRWVMTLHPRSSTPWLAAIVLGALGVALTPFTDPASVGNLVGALVTFGYMMIALCAIVDRIRRPQLERPYRMPWWPLAPGMALLAMIYMTTQLAARELVSVGVVIALSLVYYYACLAHKTGSRWLMNSPAE